MKNALQQQYAMTQFSRGIVLNFIETSVGADLNTPLPAYDNKSVRNLLEHIANCYFDWLSFFTLQPPPRALKEEGFATISLIRGLYDDVDRLVGAFLEKFGDRLDEPFRERPEYWGSDTATPLELFTQTFTHEFHHKGQILLMCRLLGHTPPDTDVYQSFNRTL
jgi:uncharacterized damage-inducible protein DinB